MPSRRVSQAIDSAVDTDYQNQVFDYILDRAYSGNGVISGYEFDSDPNMPNDLEGLLKYYGMWDEQTLDALSNRAEELILDDANQGFRSWFGNWGGLADDFDYDAIKKDLDIARKKVVEPARQARREEIEGEVDKEREEAQKERDEYYEKYESGELQKNYDEALEAFEDYKSGIKERYAAQEDLLGALENQAEEFRSKPSVVDEAFDAQLNQDLRDEIRGRQADRERYGSLSADPRRAKSRDTLALAKDRGVQKLAEDIKREEAYHNALSGVASQRGNIAAAQGGEYGTAATGIANANLGIGSFKERSAGILANKGLDKSKIQAAYDDELLRREEFGDFRNYRDDEQHRRLQRIIDAQNQRQAGAARLGGGLIGAGVGGLIGSPTLFGLGVGQIGKGIEGYNQGGVSYNQANTPHARTAGYYGQTPKYFQPQVVTAPAPFTTPTSNQYSKSSGQLSDSVFNLLQGLGKKAGLGSTKKKVSVGGEE